MLTKDWWLLLLNLSLVYLVAGHSLRNIRGLSRNYDDECGQYYLNLIHTTAAKTRIRPSNSTKIEYCDESRTKRHNFKDVVDLDEVIKIYQSPAFSPIVRSYTEATPNSPVQYYGTLSINDFSEIPVYVVADIRRHHLPPSNSRVPFDRDIERQMGLMGQLTTDDRGHLLAHSLGGSSRSIYIVPMARNVNRHYEQHAIDNRYLGIPRSYWRANEDWIRRFLWTDYPNGRVTWRIAIEYENDAIINPGSYDTYRPVSFTVQYTAYRDQNDNNTVYFTSADITYLNDNDYVCGYEESSRRRRSLEDTCEVQETKSLKGRMGNEIVHGEWAQRYKVSFPFTVAGKQYFYGQSIIDGHNWFIQELSPNGKMGEETDHGFWAYNYETVFPFFINGRTFFYGSSTDTYNWFIQELLPGGKMGSETDHGDWNQRYEIAFPFSISGKQYFYGQSILDGHNWFIQELLPGGKMGAETAHGFWNENYPVAFPFMINGRQFFYGHSHERKTWFIQELQPDGKMGEEICHGEWNQRYKVSFPFSYGGKHYFYGQSILDGHNWFIQELLPGGFMGGETSHDFWNEYYPIGFAYQIKDRIFFYGHSTDKYTWFIQELL